MGNGDKRFSSYEVLQTLLVTYQARQTFILEDLYIDLFFGPNVSHDKVS